MKPTKPIVLLTGETEMEAYHQHLNLEGYRIVFVDHYHPKHRFKQIMGSIDKGEPIVIVSNADVFVAELNNVIMEGRIDGDAVQVYQLENGALQECSFGVYGFEVPWITAYLNRLYDRTMKVQEAFMMRDFY